MLVLEWRRTRRVTEPPRRPAGSARGAVPRAGHYLRLHCGYPLQHGIHHRPGAVVVHIAPSRAVLVPVVGQTITTRPAPATGARTDYIYVEQQTQPVNGSISARVAVGTQVPDNAVVISKREIKRA